MDSLYYTRSFVAAAVPLGTFLGMLNRFSLLKRENSKKHLAEAKKTRL